MGVRDLSYIGCDINHEVLEGANHESTLAVDANDAVHKISCSQYGKGDRVGSKEFKSLKMSIRLYHVSQVRSSALEFNRIV